MNPEQGVRFELRLESTTGGAARYALSLELPSGPLSGAAEIAPPGEVRFEWAPADEPPDWCVAAVRAQLRLLWRDHAQNGVYPRRLTRWRPEPAPAPEGAG